MNRSTTGKGSKWKLVWNDEFDGRDLEPTKWDFELGNKHGAAERSVDQLPEHQRFIDHYCRAKS